MNDPDDLLTALRAARPEPDNPPSTASPEAVALLTRILAQPQIAERERPARPTRRLVLAGIPAVVAAAAAGGIAVATRDSGGSPGTLPKATRVRTGILDAFDQASGDILAAVRSIQVSNGPAFAEQTWSYPMFPQPGQRVRSRVTELGQARQVELDEQSVYIQPEPGSQAPLTGTVLAVDYASRTWFQGSGVNAIGTTSGPTPSEIRSSIASGTFHVVGQQEINGRPSIKLTLAADYPTLSKTLWVDAQTYIPLQLAYTVADANSPTTTSNTVEYQVLPATAANLALLVPRIPAGFTRTTTDPFGCGRR
ncbi:MAG TPA: hypothetical protein VMU95_05625 [Trebonia sp.]|nr:hypothetical protein [Trebonia sp.]